MFFRFIFILTLLFCIITNAEAQTIEKHSTAKIIFAGKAIGNNKDLKAILNIKLEDGWDSYWRTPGEVGLAPSFNWSSSKNLKSANIKYPFPTRFITSGIENFGYRDNISFPINIIPKAFNKPIDLKLKLEILICKEICVPQTHMLSLHIATDAAVNQEDYKIIKLTEKNMPLISNKVYFQNIWLEQNNDDKIFLNILAKASIPFSKKTDLFIENNSYLIFGEPKVAYNSNNGYLYLKSPLRSEEKLDEVIKIFTNNNLVFTITDKGRAFEINKTKLDKKTILNIPPNLKGNIKEIGIKKMLNLKIIILALLGGLILNLMPCVLPVLSIKIISILKHGGKNHRIHRWKLFKSFIATAMGIIFSFWLMAGFVIALKLSGNSIGWGMQFQYPPFIIFLIIILSGFAINMWGLFEIPMPNFILKKSYGLDEREAGFIGNFLTGSLATLLSTPCSAPFLGTAVSFALAGSPTDILIIFTFLGLGLATPYILLAISPRIFKYMPKPGKWMITLKKILAIALAVTVAWLINILIAIYTVPTIDIGWQKFDESLIAPAIKKGKVVLVDVTADWCLTCKVNENFILENKKVSKALSSKNILKLQADWTHKDIKISNYLKKYNRYGIPFNIIYGPAAPNGITLSEILTTKEILSALKKAAGE